MGKLQDCIAKVKASHNLSEEDIDVILETVEDGGSVEDGVNNAIAELQTYREGLVAQIEESYPELVTPEEAPPPKPKAREISESQKKKGRSRILNASYRELANHGDIQQFAGLNELEGFTEAARSYVENYIRDRRDAAKEKNDGIELAVLKEFLTDGKINAAVFNADYYKTLMGKARRAAENAEKERKKAEFEVIARDALRATQWGNMDYSEIRSFIRGWRHALARKTKSTLTDQGEYAGAGFTAARALMAKHNMSAGKQAKFIGTGGRLRRLHEMTAKELTGEKTNKQFLDAIYRAANRSDIMTHDIIHPMAPGGVHRVLDLFRDNIRTFKVVQGRKYGGGTRSWQDSYSQAMLSALENAYDSGVDTSFEAATANLMAKRKEIQQAADEYIETLSELMQVFEDNKDGSVESLMEKLAAKYGKQKQVIDGEERVVTPKARLDLKRYDDFWWHQDSFLTNDREARVVQQYIENQGEPYVPPKRTKPLIRKKLDTIVRKGYPLHRGGKNITAQQIQKDLGFREIFAGLNGNVQEHMNYGYDAYMDLAQILEIEPQKIGMSDLWFGVGALGQGGKNAAHFSPNWPLPSNEGDIPEGYVAGQAIRHIHLTATSGDGTVSHEWTHALDDTLRNNNGAPLMNALVDSLKQPYVSMQQIERDMVNAYNNGYIWGADFREEALAKYPGNTQNDKKARAGYSLLLWMLDESKPGRFRANYPDRATSNFYADAIRLDDKAPKLYWSTSAELIARAGEAYFYDAIINDDKRSDYLVNDWVADDAINKKAGYKGRPYPAGEERKHLNTIFESFLQNIDWTGEKPAVRADWMPEQGLIDKQEYIDNIKQLIDGYDAFEQARRKEAEEQEAKAKAAEAEALQEERDRDVGGLEALAEMEEEVDLIEDAVEQEEEPLIEDMNDDQIEGLIDEVEADIETASQEDYTDQEYGEKSDDQTVAELMAEAGEHGTEALKNALDGLAELFGGKGTLNTFPPGFDPESYAKAKPLFISAFGELKLSLHAAKKIIAKLLNAFPSMKPYLNYFLKTDYKQMQLHKRSFAQYLYEQMKAGSAPTNNAQLKRMLALQKGKPTDEISQYEMKEAQEAIEVAVVRMARDIVAGTGTPAQKYNSLVDLYQKQPLLNIDTTTSAMQQAYSTPVPMSYLASLAAEAGSGTVFEPTAGNGSLLIGTDPANARANELNEERANNLRGLGFTVDSRDALDYVEGGWIKRKVDAVLANPPFGALDEAGREKMIRRTDYKIEKLDHAIVAEALRAMKNDGKATIIIGANKAEGEISNQDRVFFNWLYSNYNIKDHFEIDGSLYRRQGAGWPVRFITIEGRKDEDESVSPVTGDIDRLNNWSDIYARVTGNELAEGMVPEVATPEAGAGTGRGGAPGAGAPTDVTGVAPEPVGGEAVPTGEAGAESGAGIPAGTGTGGTGGAGAGRTGRAGGPAVGTGDRLGAGESAVGAEPGAAGPAGRPSVPRGDQRAGKRLDEYQAQYVTFSESEADTQLRVPANQSQAITDSLNRLTSEVGSLDSFLLDRLGYESTAELYDALAAHQIDAVALAIHQIERGKALIIGDQTGVGKGRQAAAIIRYAKRQGKTPIFFTAKADLYSDMHRDLVGIDEAHNPWITNIGGDVKDTSGEQAVSLFKQSDKENRKTVEFINKNGRLPEGRDMVFSTYSQIQNETSVNRRKALLALAPNSILILDESHNAAGDSARGEFMTEMLELTSGATYLSATYSKRPETMPIYFKTDMFDAVDSNDDLIDAMTAGGEPLQQAVSNMLAKSGQLISRQRTFEGIKMDTKVIGEPMADEEAISDEEQNEADNQIANADAVSKVLRAIHNADEAFNTIAVPRLEREANKDGMAAFGAGSKASKISVSHSPFTSTIFNITRQMLFAAKVNSIADQAIAAHKRGEKPIIAVSNTMETMYSEFAAKHKIKSGDDISMLKYADVLRRSLDKVRRVKYRDKKGYEWYETVALEELPAQVQTQFMIAERLIKKMPDTVNDNMPASPIDWITSRLENEGITVGELTGRQTKIMYEDGKATFAKRTKEERNGVQVAKDFNDKKNRALILNISGSTGISLHAAAEFGDKATRHMFIAQPELDINIYVQILGRINRFQQLKKPIYTSITTAIPAELRLLSMLYAKLKKLNANITSDTKSNTQIDAPDILNKYGDQIVKEWAEENREVVDAYPNLLQGIADEPGSATKMTGRMAMLPVEEQRAFYDNVVPAYESLIEELTARGENDLITEMLDFDAILTDSEVIIEGKDPTSEFGVDTVWGMYSVKRQGNPPTPAQVAKRLLQSLKTEQGQITGEEYITQYVAGLKEKIQPEIDAAEQRIQDLDKALNVDKYRNMSREELEKDIEYQEIKKEHSTLSSAITRAKNADAQLLRSLKSVGFGEPLTFRTEDGEPMQGVVVEIKSTLASPTLRTNPMAPSRNKIVVMVNNGKRELPFTLSKFLSDSEYRRKWYGRNTTLTDKLQDTFSQEDTESRERQQIITGNLIAGLTEAEVAKRGRIINFTMNDGREEIGIRLPRSFDRGSMLSGNVPMREAEDIYDFVVKYAQDRDLRVTGLQTGVGVSIYPAEVGINIWVPGSKQMKKTWWGNPKITQYTGDFVDAETTGSTKRKVVNVTDRESAINAIRELQKKTSFFALKSMAKEAKAFIEERAPKESIADLRAEERPSISMQEAQTVLDSLNLPDNIKSRVKIKQGLPGDQVRGRYNPREGNTEIYYNKITSLEDALRTMRHEIVGHWGFRELMGEADFNALKQRVDMAANTDRQIGAIARRVRELYPELTPLQQAEEIIAKVAEEEINTSMATRLWNFIKGWLRRVGLIRDDISMAELQELVRRSAANIASPTGAREYGRVQREAGWEAFSGLFESDESWEQRYDNPEQEAMAAKVGNRVDNRTAYEKLKDKWSNEIRPRLWKKVEQGLFDRYASIRDVDLHSWKLARMSHTASGVVEHLFKYGRVEIAPGGGVQSPENEADTQKSLSEILSPLGEETDRWFNWMIANRAEGLAAEERENWLTETDIAAGKTMNQGTMANGENREELYEIVRRDFNALHEHVLDLGEQLEVISPEERATWENEFYIPFFRIMDGEVEADGPRMLDGLTGQTAYYRLKGAEKQIGDPLANVMMNWHHIIGAGLKNQAANMTLRHAIDMGIAEEIEPNRFKPKGAFFVRQDGKKVWFTVSDPLVLDAISALNLSDLDFAGMRAMRWFKRAFTMGVTANPEFMLANLIRDSIHSAAVTPTGKNPLMNAIKGYQKVGGLGIFNNELAGEALELDRRMLAGGGALHFGFLYADDPMAAKRQIMQHLDEDTILTDEEGSARYRSAAQLAWRRWKEAGSRLENVNRAQLYAKLRAEGAPEFEAQFQARDLLDFSQGGSNVLVRFLTQSVPFLNARLQGLHKLGRAAMDKNQRKQFLAVTGAYVAAALALYLMYKDDDDFKKREEWDRDSYHWFRVGDTAFRIPRPFEIGVLATIAERIAEQMVDEEATGELFAERMLFALNQTFEFDPVPHMFRPILNVATDKDPFTKRRIEGEALRDLPPEERRRIWTSETAIALSEGMSKVMWEEVTLSPVQIEHLIRGYFGWIGGTALSATDNIVTRNVGYQPTRPSMRIPADLPLFGRFARDLPEPHTKYMTRFYEQNEEIRKVYNAFNEARKQGLKDKAKELLLRDQDLIKWRETYGKVERALAKVNREIMRIRMSDMARAEKKARIDRLTQKKNELAEKLVKKRGY